MLAEPAAQLLDHDGVLRLRCLFLLAVLRESDVIDRFLLWFALAVHRSPPSAWLATDSQRFAMGVRATACSDTAQSASSPPTGRGGPGGEVSNVYGVIVSRSPQLPARSGASRSGDHGARPGDTVSAAAPRAA